MSVALADERALPAAFEPAQVRPPQGRPLRVGRRIVRRLLVVAGLAGGAWILGSALSHSAADAAPLATPRPGSVLSSGTVLATVTSLLSSPTDELTSTVDVSAPIVQSPTHTANSPVATASTTVIATVHQVVTGSRSTVSDVVTVVRTTADSAALPIGTVLPPIGTVLPPIGTVGSGPISAGPAGSPSLPSGFVRVHPAAPAAAASPGRVRAPGLAGPGGPDAAPVAAISIAGPRSDLRPHPCTDGRNPTPSTPTSPAPNPPNLPSGSASGSGAGIGLIDRVLPTGGADRSAPGSHCARGTARPVVNALLDAPAFSPD